MHDDRVQLARKACTKAELEVLKRDLGAREGPDLQHVMVIACCPLVAIAAWKPVIFSSWAWAALALPVTAGGVAAALALLRRLT